MVAIETEASGVDATTAGHWYSVPADAVATAFDVDPQAGLSDARAAELLATNGPERAPRGASRRPVGSDSWTQYRSYMQLILCRRGDRVAARQGVEHGGPAGVPHRAERGRRAPPGGQGRERDERAEVDDEGDGAGAARRRRGRNLRPRRSSSGDVVLLAAGDQVPADGRIIAASALQIDESALDRRERPGRQGRETPSRATTSGPGDQSNMAFMNTPVTHGSGDAGRDRDRCRHRAREDLGHVVGDREGAVAADEGAQHA